MQRDVLIVFAGFGVMENGGDLLLVLRAEHKGGIVEGLLGQERQGLWLNLQYRLSFKFANANVIGGQEIILRFVFPHRERRLIYKFFIRHMLPAFLIILNYLNCIDGVPRDNGRHARCCYRNPYMAAKIQPNTQETLTPIKPGRIKLWLMTKRPMWVVPERSN